MSKTSWLAMIMWNGFSIRVVFTEWPNYTKGIIFRNEFPNIDHGPRLYTQRIIFIVACECISHTWEGSNGIIPFHNCVTEGSAVHVLEHICEYLYHLTVSWSHCLSVRTPNESVWNFLELFYYANTACTVQLELFSIHTKARGFYVCIELNCTVIVKGINRIFDLHRWSWLLVTQRVQNWHSDP